MAKKKKKEITKSLADLALESEEVEESPEEETTEVIAEESFSGELVINNTTDSNNFGFKKGAAKELEGRDYFLELTKRINAALSTEQGKRLNCRMKVVVEGQEAYIYQGLRNNVYARIFSDKPHRIYRYTLKKLLTTNEATKEFFTADKIRS